MSETKRRTKSSDESSSQDNQGARPDRQTRVTLTKDVSSKYRKIISKNSPAGEGGKAPRRGSRPDSGAPTRRPRDVGSAPPRPRRDEDGFGGPRSAGRGPRRESSGEGFSGRPRRESSGEGFSGGPGRGSSGEGFSGGPRRGSSGEGFSGGPRRGSSGEGFSGGPRRGSSGEGFSGGPRRGPSGEGFSGGPRRGSSGEGFSGGPRRGPGGPRKSSFGDRPSGPRRSQAGDSYSGSRRAPSFRKVRDDAPNDFPEMQIRAILDRELPESARQVRETQDLLLSSANDIMALAEQLGDIHKKIGDALGGLTGGENQAGVESMKEALGQAQGLLMSLFEKLCFQDLAGQRLNKVDDFCQALTCVLPSLVKHKKTAQRQEAAPEKKRALKGPQAKGGGLGQGDIDDLLKIEDMLKEI